MPPPDHLAPRNSSPWCSLEQLLSQLEAVLARGGTIDVRDLLPPPGTPHYRGYLLELVRAEMASQYKEKRGQLLEKYLEKYPELNSSSHLLPLLVYEEYRGRRSNGECPSLSSYQERFPEAYPELLRLIKQQEGELPGAKTLPPVNPVGTLRETIQHLGPPPKVTPAHAIPRVTAAPSSEAIPALGEPEGLPGGLPELLLGPGGYELILPPLGKGEYGEVFKARAPGGVLVAVKRLFRPLDHQATRTDLAALEKISQLNHPYLLQTHCFGVSDQKLVIVMELADGSLMDRLRHHQEQGRPGIPLDELLPYFHQAAEALDFLHGENLLHRDIKPQNLLQLKGYAKVADFGLVRHQLHDVSRITVMSGTPLYMPPESWKQLSSIHGDQYSLAATYVEMRLGRPLFQATNLVELMQVHTEATPDLNPLPEAEQRVLLKALAKEPEARFPSCRAFLGELERSTAPAPPPPPPPTASPPILAILLIFALVGALAWMGWDLLHSSGGPQRSRVDWIPDGWKPADAVAGETATLRDSRGKTYYRRLVRPKHGHEIEMVAIPQEDAGDPATFYIMKNKVWNGLFTAFTEQEKDECEALFKKYSSDRPGCQGLISRRWHEGALDNLRGKDLGTGPGKEKLPVFRVTVTEAHCFAEWLGGKLPSREQWLKAAGALKTHDPAWPFYGDPRDLAVQLGEGPWPVGRGERDVTPEGCRQLRSNGQEWTRTSPEGTQEINLIPLKRMHTPPKVSVVSQSYDAEHPLDFARMIKGDLMEEVTRPSHDISFRVVLEQ